VHGERISEFLADLGEEVAEVVLIFKVGFDGIDVVILIVDGDLDFEDAVVVADHKDFAGLGNRYQVSEVD
jgi:hypothetical protein